jgi:hypothetical protein
MRRPGAAVTGFVQMGPKGAVHPGTGEIASLSLCCD